ncbi:hypothetical protein OKA04_06925 [Luteolibacter flavescens]|uniref:Uncharacterized protein n=1 Tax=Luteolibacter flavescens TaxID=1859460 RepID=A0ABT3FLM4_9BACT|nr:hypothetical protein [Luteolibacter flavescens]MCW1884458.1 hypothetical protein [Luteolibacter flavescens]
MVAYQHPAGLNPLQRFRQAGSVLRGTSRADNTAWYRSALELDFQLHLRADGNRVDSRLFDRRTGQWSTGPQLSEAHATDLTLIPAFADEIIRVAQAAKANAIGVVLHLADEFATSELKPELDNPGALSELRTMVESDPKSVLDDSSVSATESSWRLIPYPAAGSEAIATTVCISRGWTAFLDELRKAGEEKNFPVITRAVSAPLVCLLALPELKQDEMTNPLIAVLSYPRFTLLAFFNEHGDLRLLRTLQHRGQRRPTNLRHAASTTAAALELADPEVYLLATGEFTDPQMVADLQLVFPAASIREIEWAGTPYAPPAPGISPELLISTNLAATPETPLASSHTFTVLKGDGWAVQDFLPVAKEVAEVYPNRSEMKMLRTARYARLGFAVLAAVALGFFGLQIIDLIRKPEFASDSSRANAQKERRIHLTAEKNRVDHWDNLLEDRSKAWTTMELLSALFPEKSGFLIKTFNHGVTPEASPGQVKAGFVREWRITGLARDEAYEKLALLNTQDGISAIFKDVANSTGNESFETDLPTRSLVVTARTLENGGYRPGPAEEAADLDDNSYPFSFELTITQRFESADKLAITVAAAP